MLRLLTHSAPWQLLFLGLRYAVLASAWSLASDCTSNDAVKVNEAMPNAIAMADYATKRAAQDPGRYPRKGNLLQDMLGASDENDANALSLARRKNILIEFKHGATDTVRMVWSCPRRCIWECCDPLQR